MQLHSEVGQHHKGIDYQSWNNLEGFARHELLMQLSLISLPSDLISAHVIHTFQFCSAELLENVKLEGTTNDKNPSDEISLLSLPIQGPHSCL